MVKWVSIVMIGNIMLLCCDAENDSITAFNGFLLFLLSMYIIASFFNWITADKKEIDEKQKEGLMWYAWWIIILIFGVSALGRTVGINPIPFMTFITIMFLWLITHIFLLIHKKIIKYKKAKTPIEDKYLDKLGKLSVLRLQGAITDEEFEEQKSKIMKK